MSTRHELVSVPRAMLSKYQHAPWAELRAAAERGDDGLSLTNDSAFGYSYFRAPDKGGLLDRDGASSLFCQGWVA
jgi:hypothetical protein